MLACGGGGALLALAGCASAVASAESAAVAPAGVLRASINLGNPVLASRDPVTGAPTGVSVDLARVLAAELGVACELITFDAAAKSVAAVTSARPTLASSRSTRCAAKASPSPRPTC